MASRPVWSALAMIGTELVHLRNEIKKGVENASDKIQEKVH